MNECLDQLRHRWMRRGYPAVYIRCGIHAARVFVGNIGSQERMKYGVLGDGVNLASRLEELNKKYCTKVLISGPVVLQPRVQESFVLRMIDKVVVKGRKEPTAIFEVMARKFVAPSVTIDEEELQYFDQKLTFGASGRIHLPTTAGGRPSLITHDQRRRKPDTNAEGPEAGVIHAEGPEGGFIHEPMSPDRRLKERGVANAARTSSGEVFLNPLWGKTLTYNHLIEARDKHEAGMKAYFARRFEEAAALMKETGEMLHQDVASRIIMERSLRYLKTPPARNWNGAEVMTSK